jgi:hypothetical protein
LRHCATVQEVMGSIPNVAVGIFHGLDPTGHTMALESPLPLTEMSTRKVPGAWG